MKYPRIYSSIAALTLIDPSLASDSEKARIAYPKPFSRPPNAGQDYETWLGAKRADVGETMVDPKRLPSRVDNSERPQFPPVYEQKWGTCGQHAAIASVFTYEMNALYGTSADSDARRFPAYFSWNMINEAKDNGSEAYHGWEVAKTIGIPTSQSYGGAPPEKIGVWPSGYKIWHEAMKYRVLGYRYSPATTVDQLNEARGWLFDRNQLAESSPSIGGIFAMDGRMDNESKATVTIPPGEHAAGEDLWTGWEKTGYGHGLTCVGYDDQVGFDLNNDGKITNDIDTNKDGNITLADWERGAYIVVNSWGEKWSGDGRIYLLYSGMVDPTWERGNYLGRIEVGRQTPRITLRLKLSCDDRSALRVNIGMTNDLKAKAPTTEFSPPVLNGWPLFGGRAPGQVPMVGPDDSTPIEIGIDLTQLGKDAGRKPGKKGRLFLRFGRADDSKAVGKLHECAIRYYNAEGVIERESVIVQKESDFVLKELTIQTLIK